MKKFVSIVLVIISCAFSKSVTASEMIINEASYGPTTNTLPTEIYKFICEDSLVLNAGCNPKITNIVDLNGDGELEIFISGENALVHQGTGGWTSWLYTYTNKKFELREIFFGYDVEVTRKKTNGYLDLKQEYKSYTTFLGGPPHTTRTRSFKWDKEKMVYVEK